jgi:hypothetical protein
VWAATLAARGVNGPFSVLARGRSRSKWSFSCQMTPSVRCLLLAAHRRTIPGQARLALSCEATATRAPFL